MKILKNVGRVMAFVGATLAILVAVLYSAMWIMVNGPSESVGKLFVLSVRETSAAGFLADWFMSPDEIKALYDNQNNDQNIEIDKDLIQIPKPNDPTTDAPVTSDDTDAPVTDAPPTAVRPDDNGGVEVIDIIGKLYNGKMLIIKDPKRVFVGTPDAYGYDKSGLKLTEMVVKYDVIAGVNAGGFYDPNGTGTGGVPDGIVISGGKLMWGELSSYYNLAGIDGDGILHVGSMTAQHALDLGIKEAASYGPALIVNGVPRNTNAPLGGGINPRTAIGQRADGAILLLVINGRSADSLGATYDDLVDVMMQHGAVNATNLDGGSSSLMIYDGEVITKSSYIFGERVVATAFLVRREQ